MDNHGTNTSLNSPVIIEENQVISGGSINPEGINGILIDLNPEIEVVWASVTNSNFYEVPIGKTLYINNVHNWQTELLINDIGLSFDSNLDYTHSLGIPLIATSGAVISSNNGLPAHINGYLVDEDYFADCGGGSSNNQSIEQNEPEILEIFASDFEIDMWDQPHAFGILTVAHHDVFLRPLHAILRL